MGADDKVDLPFFDLFDVTLLLRGENQTRHLGDVDPKRTEAFQSQFIMLPRQQSGRSKHRDLFAATDGLKSGAEGDLGFAKADVATKQTVHGFRFFHVFFDFVHRTLLVGG